jgi:dipeptidyl aminopeptidase/acylaminoacyl peptidase
MCNVDKAVNDGIVDPERMGVIGHSHGGTEVNWIVSTLVATC